jgi:hypothetical protein
MDFNVESRSLPLYIWPDLSALVDIPTAMNQRIFDLDPFQLQSQLTWLIDFPAGAVPSLDQFRFDGQDRRNVDRIEAPGIQDER